MISGQKVWWVEMKGRKRRRLVDRCEKVVESNAFKVHHTLRA